MDYGHIYVTTEKCGRCGVTAYRHKWITPGGRVNIDIRGADGRLHECAR